MLHLVPSEQRPGYLSLRRLRSDRTWWPVFEAFNSQGFRAGDVIEMRLIERDGQIVEELTDADAPIPFRLPYATPTVARIGYMCLACRERPDGAPPVLEHGVALDGERCLVELGIVRK